MVIIKLILLIIFEKLHLEKNENLHTKKIQE